MRFSHTADCHLGGHRDPRLRQLSSEAFKQFVSKTIAHKSEFAIISGDLFNTAIPGIDALKTAVSELNRLKENKISVYVIPGSHDYSPSGRTMLSVLEEAGLLTNVWKGDIKDKTLKLNPIKDKSGVLLTGVLGRAGSLDREQYERLDHDIENLDGPKIFLFHTAITELVKNPMIQSQKITSLPKNFDYYAGGHIHIRETYQDKDYKLVAYPGPLFPNSFSEFEDLEHGSFIFYEDGIIKREKIRLKPVKSFSIDVEMLDSNQASEKLLRLKKKDVKDSIVLVRIFGKLASGNTNDIQIRDLVKSLEENGAFCVLRNTSKLSTSDFNSKELKAEEPKDLEKELVEEHKDELSLKGKNGTELALKLLQILGREQKEGEKQYEYRDSVVEEALTVIEK